MKIKRIIGRELYLIRENLAEQTDSVWFFPLLFSAGAFLILPLIISIFLPHNPCPWANPFTWWGKAIVVIYYLVLRGADIVFWPFIKVRDYFKSCIEDYEDGDRRIK